MRTKYHSKKVTSGGHSFDSKKECRRWNELQLLEQDGQISNLQRQVKYILIPAQYGPQTIGPRGGVKRGPLLERECAYIADFVYWKDRVTVVEDAKGVRTADYIIKRKLMLERYGIRILET